MVDCIFAYCSNDWDFLGLAVGKALVLDRDDLVLRMIKSEGSVFAEAFASRPSQRLVQWSAEGYDEMIQAPLDVRAHVNAGDEPVQHLPLNRACRGGHTRVVGMLLDAGADVHAGGTEDKLPILQASEKGRANIVRMLVACGTNVNAMDAGSRSPLLVALKKGHEDVVHVLVEAGADVNSKIDCYETPLSIACGSSSVDTIRTLLDAGANVNATAGSEYGSRTPLLSALGWLCWPPQDHAKKARMLLDAGADTNLKDHIFCTPLHAACSIPDDSLKTCF